MLSVLNIRQIIYTGMATNNLRAGVESAELLKCHMSEDNVQHKLLIITYNCINIDTSVREASRHTDVAAG
jgi:hypothetical protein